MTKASDTQVGGDHYKAMGDFQPWDDQPTDGAKCCGQPNTCENPCFHCAQPEPEVCCGRFEECSHPCVPRVRQQADAEGWIKWQGGTCPVPDTTPVQYVLRNGDSSTMMAGRLAWNHRGSTSDIVAYRIINPTT